MTKEPRFRVIGSDLWSDEAGFADTLGQRGITGICGSGIIEVIAEMRMAGLLDPGGLIGSAEQTGSARCVPDGRTHAYLLHDGSATGGAQILVTQGDVRAIQLAKSALYAGARLLMDRMGVERVDRIVLAGAFGAHISPKHAMVLGMIPDCALDRVSSAGNAAGTGAQIALLNAGARAEVEALVGRIHKVETATEPDSRSISSPRTRFPMPATAFPRSNARSGFPRSASAPAAAVATAADAGGGEARRGSRPGRGIFRKTCGSDLTFRRLASKLVSERQREDIALDAPRHPRQHERLRALRDYEILDTDREKDFDDIVTLAAAICEAPMSLISFIDEHRQWFKAETGVEMRESPLRHSICAHAIVTGSFLEIPDTRKDLRTADNPLVCGYPRVRFYAGVPLFTEDGLPLGTLCVLDTRPRSLNALQRDTIRVLARQVMVQLEMRKALRLTTLLRQEVDHRVKNSLQLLVSLVRMQARHAGSRETVDILATVNSHIEAVARLHELLHRTDAGSAVDLAQYLTLLTKHFGSIAPQNVRFSLDADSVEVDSNKAIAIGTFVNEFATNSFKHAFPDGREGLVRISLSVTGNSARLVCADNGVGLPERVASAPGGQGMKIAEAICSELQTSLEVESSVEGHSVTLEFAI